MSEFTFLYPLWLLALFPLLLLVPWLRRNTTRQQGLIAAHLADKLGIGQSSSQKALIPGLSLLWILSCIALAGPSWQKDTVPAYSLSGARVLVMDMSQSMYATDMIPNRLSQARYKALDLLPSWQEGSTGLVAYAGDGYTISPLTRDAQTLANLIPYLSPEIMPIAGSNAAAGIKEAIDLLKQAGFQDGDIILITDGLSESESAASLRLLKANPYRLSVLAVGSIQGAPIQLPDGRLLTDNAGQTVISKLNINTITPLVKATNGIFVQAGSSNHDIEKLISATEKPEQAANKDKQQTLEERINNGFWLMIPIVILALFGFRRGIVLAAALVLIPVEPVHANVVSDAFNNRNIQGHQLFEQGNYAEAAKHFNDPRWKGSAYYRAEDYQQAIDTWKPLKDNDSRFNLGNAYTQAGQLDDAANTYQKLLADNPDYPGAAENLKTVEALKKQQQANNEQSQQGQQQNNNGQSQQGQQQDNNGQSQQGQQQDNNGQSQQGQQQDNNGQSQQGQQQDNNGQSQQGQQQDNNGQSQQAQQQDNNGQSQQGQQQQGAVKQSDEKSENASAAVTQSNDLGNKQEGEKSSALVPSDSQNGNEAIQASDPILKKLEQIPDDTSALIRAQMILQARERRAPRQTDNSW